jgi:predicted secreted protein
MSTLSRLTLVAALCLPSATLLAAESTTQLTLTGRAQEEVDNDQVTVQLYAQENQPNAARLADSLNRTMKRGLSEANQVAGIDTSGGQVRTWPQYDRNGHITGWQGRGEITIRGKQTTQMAELVGRLQSYLQVENVQFSLSDNSRRKTESHLIEAAIRDLQARAQEVSRSLSKPHMQIKELTLNDQNNIPIPRPLMLKAAMSATDNAVTPPTWQAGKSTISVEVMGKVELQ